MTQIYNKLIELQYLLLYFYTKFKNNKMYLNEFCQVLVENKLSNQEKYFGRTKFMTPVIFGSDNCKNGDIVNIKITSFNKNNLFGFHKTNINEKAA